MNLGVLRHSNFHKIDPVPAGDSNAEPQAHGGGFDTPTETGPRNLDRAVPTSTIVKKPVQNSMYALESWAWCGTS